MGETIRMSLDKRLEICRAHVASAALGAVVPEPYVPYVPDPWNETVVLAEAQNLSAKTNSDYLEQLLSRTPEQRMKRLGDIEDIGIQPWDDGSIKLALVAASRYRPEETAVSNAVPWSQVGATGNNVTPSQEMIELAVAFWRDMLGVLAPATVITCGKVAGDVIDAASGPTRRFEFHRWRLPSPSALSRVSGMFSEKDLLSRYPEVAQVRRQHPEWAAAPYARNKVFFACHAVSLMVEGSPGPFGSRDS